MDNIQLRKLLEAQQALISNIALGATLTECLQQTCRLIENVLDDPKARASILILKGNQLHHGAAPSIASTYCDLIDGVEIGPEVGSCGTAAFLNKQIIVTDINTDPLWRHYKNFALDAGLQACWSTPILSSSGKVLGSFAIYYTDPKSPEPEHLELISRFTHLSSLCIEKSQSENREKELTSKLKRSNEKLSTFANVMPDLSLVIDEFGTYVDIYGGEKDLLVGDSKELLGKKVSEVLPEEEARSIMDVIDRAIRHERIEVFEYSLLVPKGLRYFEGRVSAINHYQPESPNKKHVLWLARDITDKRVAEAQIEQLAFYDPLTGLANRRLLNEHLNNAIDKTHRSSSKSVLLYMDLDDFKRINDSLGHSVGDQLLVKVAERIKPVLRSTDMFSRIGGDEFVILLEGLELDTNALIDASATLAQKVISIFKESFSIHGKEYKIGISIGISIIQGPRITLDEVLKRADTAMYRSKRLGGNHYTFFDPVLQQALDDRLTIEHSLLHAIQTNQLTAHFQSQVSADGHIIGAEALVRWMHPEKGFISPLEFIPVAEQFGLINAIQEIVLKESCELIRRLTEEKLIDKKSFSLSINISANQFKNQSLKTDLLQTLEHQDIEPKQIKLEITESMLIDDVEAAVQQMQELKAMGFEFSIDDFGTGYSSLTYLHTFPINELKIDKSFIDRIHDHDAGLGIVDAIIALSNHLNFDVIAEGVEDASQKGLLIERNVKAMQGYFFSKPLPADEFIHYMKTNT